MTYRQAIIAEFSADDRTSIVRQEFLMGMAAVLCKLAWILCKADMPSISIGDEEATGKGIENPSVQDVLCVFSSVDFVRSIHMSRHTMLFLDWLLDQEIETKSFEDDEDEDEEVDDAWYSASGLTAKWNEFIILKNKEETK